MKLVVVSFDGLLSCRRFTRGWTLQELIAPRALRFYDKSWTLRGTKDSYAKQICLMMNMHPLVLQDSGYLTQLSIAERMTLALGRQTTRVEDMTYCLLGIFDINMPLLYGEGDKAFGRLQQEIIKNSNDLSIFGWSPKSTVISPTWRPGFGRDRLPVVIEISMQMASMASWPRLLMNLSQCVLGTYSTRLSICYIAMI